MTNPYKEITFLSVIPEQVEVLIAWLAEAGYEGFEEREQMLLAYIPAQHFDPNRLADLARSVSVSYTIEESLATNWNAHWESNFEPVTMGSFLHIRASFHPPYSLAQHEIVITPKMSFGTGHHASTRLMAQAMASLDFQDKKVLDFGTGTGILAILAEKLGASRIVAIDDDEWSIQNAQENIAANHCNRIELIKQCHPRSAARFEFVLANINLSVICQHLTTLVQVLEPGGQMLLSGFLREDISALEALTLFRGLRSEEIGHTGEWGLIRLSS